MNEHLSDINLISIQNTSGNITTKLINSKITTINTCKRNTEKEMKIKLI
jgi:hypothetical protein